MRRLHRPDLSAAAQRFLTDRTHKVRQAADHAVEARRLWRLQDNKNFAELRSTLQDMASGRCRCMYCEDGTGTDIDHFRPLATHPLLAYTWPNHLLACSFCNSHAKRDVFPLDPFGEPLLIDPTADEPSEHLTLSFSNGEFFPLTPKGSCTISLLGLNDHKAPRSLPDARRDALAKVIALVLHYAATVNRAPDQAEAARRAATHSPFSSVLWWTLRACDSPNADLLLPSDFLHAVQAHDVRSWI
jgi:5-methylcytosine-specific restriction endonuclease McrA